MIKNSDRNYSFFLVLNKKVYKKGATVLVKTIILTILNTL